jgi:hypothetical protein
MTLSRGASDGAILGICFSLSLFGCGGVSQEPNESLAVPALSGGTRTQEAPRPAKDAGASIHLLGEPVWFQGRPAEDR